RGWGGGGSGVGGAAEPLLRGHRPGQRNPRKSRAAFRLTRAIGRSRHDLAVVAWRSAWAQRNLRSKFRVLGRGPFEPRSVAVRAVAWILPLVTAASAG